MDKIEKHLKALKEKHAELEIKLNEEEARPLPDSLKIQEYKKLSNNNSLIIISIPNIEIVLLSIFERIESELNKANVEKKLKLHFEKSVSKQEYEHSPEITQKIMDYLFKNKSKIFLNWKNNLIKLNELGLSNFIELINYLEDSK